MECQIHKIKMDLLKFSFASLGSEYKDNAMWWYCYKCDLIYEKYNTKIVSVEEVSNK